MAKSRNIEHYWYEDLLTMILLRLPVKSIIRFKCVSKAWRSLFENSRFVSQHLSISKEVSYRLLVYRNDYNPFKVPIRLFLDKTLVSYQDLFQQIPQHVNTRNLKLCVHGGLLCFCDTINSRISMWNPATRKFRLLPECNEGIPPNAVNILHKIGFGLYSSSNDYKVIYIRNYQLRTRIPAPCHLAVYSSITDSWRVLHGEEINFFGDLFIWDNSQDTCVNGVCYWIALKRPSRDSKVLSFHFSKEVFELIDWPPGVEPAKSIGQLIPSPDDRISLSVSHFKVSNRNYEIWVLDEERKYWTKLLRIGPFPSIRRVNGFHNKNCNKVYVESKHGELLIYDVDTQEFRGIEIKTGSSWHLLGFHIYEKSLIAI